MAPAASAASAPAATLQRVTIEASADASAQGLSPAFAGGQVARGGRAGILGTRNHLETPFSITSYTNDLIQDRQARSVGEVLQNDPGVRVARGFGNFQESYFIRGFILGSDDVAYNGLYNLLPRQYIATELFERVEVLRGASAFLNGANPGGGGIGGAINLLPKRATNEPLTRITLGVGSGEQGNLALDVGRRFGPDRSTGIRVNAAWRDGGSATDDENARLGLVAVGADWRGHGVRLSGDIGWQDHRLKRTRTNVTLSAAVIAVPTAPDASANFAQPWSYSNERDLFGTLRGEVDLPAGMTGWAAYGARRGEEANSLANLTVSNGSTGAGSTSRFDNTRRDRVDTGELGVRGTLRTGVVGHEWVLAAGFFQLEKDNAYGLSPTGGLLTNLYTPTARPIPALTTFGNDLAAPALNGRTRLASLAIGDTLSLIDDRLLVTLGLRHQKLDIVNYAYNTGVQTAHYDRSRSSPVVGIVVKAMPGLSVYANHIQGLSQGETAPGTAANRGEVLEPYVSKQKEIGLKLEQGRIGARLALFTTTRPRSLLTAANVFTSSGKDRHDGAELTVYGEAARGLKLLGGLTWLDATQRATGVATTEGRRVIGVARLQGNLGLEWRVPGVDGLSIDGRVMRNGASYANAQNTLSVPGWTRVDVGARYAAEMFGQSVTWRLRVDNLANRNHWASVGGFPGSGYLVVGAARTVSLSASLDL